MRDAQVFQFTSVGRASNVLFCAEAAFFLAMVAWCLRIFIRAFREVRREKTGKGEWRSAAGMVVTAIGVVVMAVLAGLGGGAGSSGLSEGIATGHASHVKPNTGRMLGISILGIVVLSLFLAFGIFREQPLQLAVSPQQLTLKYRLPWRNRSIPISEISRVKLVEYHTRGVYYNIIIDWGPNSIRILGDNATTDYYKAQMKSAYDAINAEVAAFHRSQSTLPPTAARSGESHSAAVSPSGPA